MTLVMSPSSSTLQCYYYYYYWPLLSRFLACRRVLENRRRLVALPIALDNVGILFVRPVKTNDLLLYKRICVSKILNKYFISTH